MNSQTENTEFFLRKLNSPQSDHIDILGLNVALLYSKNHFKKNEDISYFLKEVYNIDFLPYVMKSRTLIVARITKELNNKNEMELDVIRNKLIGFLSGSKPLPELRKKTQKKNANDKMKTWLEGL
ncbi:hypothetical protein [Priestia megaterium]|uniref:hypothetical protein n=1 Tax=Priestia megaterium TaxID=1404 RepID=UPI001EDA2F83|nr:hypothetical protein [Priestia megaterium]MCM3305825.1 hypothetical protein [Priestia megaterium]UKJ82912.1 hypothetical protein H1W83_11820 [Priestia megaterium]